MAVSVNRPIEADLSNVLGRYDPVAMIRSRSTVPIRASGLAPRKQAGHMTASDRQYPEREKTLACRGPSTHDGETGVGRAPNMVASGNITMIAVALVTSALCGVQVADAQNTGAAGGAKPPAASAARPVVAEQADRLLRQMGEYIGTADQFTFHADITFDHVLPSGQKLQYSASEDVALKRPDGLYVEWSGDLGDRQFWYDGHSITLYDPATPFYATDTAPPGMDAMLDKLVSQLGFSPPLADMLYRDPYRNVRGNVQSVSISAKPT